MGFHTFNANRTVKLDNLAKFQFVSRRELFLHLDVVPEHIVADLGSGTGFLTDEVALHVGTFYVVDVQAVMHGYYRERDTPGNVGFIAAGVVSPPFDDDHLDAAFSAMTYYEFATGEVLTELAHVVRPGGTVVMVD